jgi:hypothetical protein
MEIKASSMIKKLNLDEPNFLSINVIGSSSIGNSLFSATFIIST